MCRARREKMYITKCYSVDNRENDVEIRMFEVTMKHENYAKCEIWDSILE